MAEARNLIILNTQFAKRKNHLVAYRSGHNATQIDYILVRKEDKNVVVDCKVIPNESVVVQHKIWVADLRSRPRKRTRTTERKRRIKVWELKNAKKIEFKNILEKVLEEKYGNGMPEPVEEIWEGMKEILVTTATEVCGRTSGKPRWDKETWWWNQEVQTAIKEKRLATKRWEEDNNDQTKERYRQAKREAKRTVAVARREAQREWYEMLEIPEGEKVIYRVARARENERQDVDKIEIIKDENGNILVEENSIKSGWRDYFSQLLNTENKYEELERVLPVERPIVNINRSEVEKAINKGKANKAGGPSEIMIKVLGDLSRECVHTLLVKIWDSEKMPEDWKESEMITVYKQKGDILDCGNYREIKLLEHVFKVLERVVKGRLRELIDIHEQQFGFMKGKSTMDAIFITRQVQEKYLEGNRKVYMCFIDLEKAYDRVPREVVY